jgi:hypothetical protein
VIYATDAAAFEISKLAEATGPEAIEKLSGLRRDRARDWLRLARTFYENGVLTVDRYIDASRRLTEAELDLAKTPEERREALRAHLIRMTRALDRLGSTHSGNMAFIADLTELRCAQVDAALALARAKRAVGEPKPRIDAAPKHERQERPKDQSLRKPLHPGARVGKVTSLLAERNEARIDFGKSAGASVGMVLELSHDRDIEPLDDRPRAGRPKRDPLKPGFLVITEVEAQQSTARFVERLEAPPGEQVGFREPQPGEEVLRIVDPDEVVLVFDLGDQEKPDAVEQLKVLRAAFASHWLEAALEFFENGSIRFHRYLAAASLTGSVESEAAANREAALAALRTHLIRLASMLRREATSFQLEDIDQVCRIAQARLSLAEAAIALPRLKESSRAR